MGNDKVNDYDIIYKWFDILKSNGHFLNGYFIMPGHIHVLISFINVKQSVNTIIGNCKRFMAYEIIDRLEKNSETDLLAQLADGKCLQILYFTFITSSVSGFVYEAEQWVYSSPKHFARSDGIINWLSFVDEALLCSIQQAIRRNLMMKTLPRRKNYKLSIYTF